MLNRAKDYYENDEERLREQVRNKYRNLSEEDKKKKRKYRNNRYQYVWRKEARIERISKTKISRSKRV